MQEDEIELPAQCSAATRIVDSLQTPALLVVRQGPKGVRSLHANAAAAQLQAGQPAGAVPAAFVRHALAALAPDGDGVACTRDLVCARIAEGFALVISQAPFSVRDIIRLVVELQDGYDRAPAGYHSLDERGMFVGVNEVESDWLGYAREELVGKLGFQDLLTGESQRVFRSRVRSFKETGQVNGLELDIRRKDGSILPVLMNSTAVYDDDGHFVLSRSVMVDLAQKRAEEQRVLREAEREHAIALERARDEIRRQAEGRERALNQLSSMEEQLRQAMKMEAVGRLAGGVAHDFNNMLSVILSFTSFVLEELPPDDPHRADLVQVCEASERAARLTTQLLAFSRQQVVEVEPIDINAVVGEVERMLRRIVGEDVQLETRLRAKKGRVLTNRGHVEQVLLNLAVNARDAMPKGGHLLIETDVVQLDAEYAASHLDVKPGTYVCLAVSDTGAGMDKATLERVFEPFFTTKGPGEGTGLGLSTVYGIVKQAGGHTWVYSEPGRGSTFKIYLPRVASGSTTRPEAKPATLIPTKGQSILLVEDDDLVRQAAKRILRGQGYVVLEATTPQAALDVAQGEAVIDLMLTDVVMPGQSGPDLATAVRAMRRNLPVIFMSGYSDRMLALRGGLGINETFLQKPLTPEALLRKVREALETAG